MRRRTCSAHPGIYTDHQPCYRCPPPKEAPMKDTTVAVATISGGKRIEGELGTAEGEKVVETLVRGVLDAAGVQTTVDHSTGEILPFVQPTLDDKVFAVFTPEHQVSLKLTKGSDKRSLGLFGKLLSGEVLERGREVIVTARYFAKAVHVPAAMTEHGFVARGDGTVELELINVRSLEVGKQLLRTESPWKACYCVEPYDIETDGEYPGGRRVLEYPLDGWSASQSCTACAGLGYVRPVQKPDDVNPEDGDA